MDASVAAKWILNEAGRDQALTLLRGYRQGRLRLWAPRLIVYEIGNLLWRKSRTGELTAGQSELAFSLFQINRPRLADSETLMDSALRLANAHDRTYYDSLYLALALALGCPLATADKKLYHALRPAYPATLALIS